MKGDFEPGDLVVCIATESPCCGDMTPTREMPQPDLGSKYVVSEVGLGECRMCGAVMACFSPSGYESGPWSWPQVIFKKVDPRTFKSTRKHKVEA